MLIQSLFAKDIEDITAEDLILFFTTPRFESDKMEFKSFQEFDPNKESGSKSTKEKEAFKKIIFTICAFLNTDGGLLIWGAPKEIIENHKKSKFQGHLAPVKKTFEKDQIINKIISEINPTPNRILFKAINTVDDYYVYIFYVSPSDYAPHQVKGTYYMRLDGQTKYAPHQYVDALIKKIKIPKLEMLFRFGEIKRLGDLVYLPFVLSISNKSQFINEKKVILRISSFAHIQEESEIFNDLLDGTNKEKSVAEILHFGNPIKEFYILITTMNYGKGIRRIPIYASLLGENSPIIYSYYEIEIQFTDNLRINYSLNQVRENDYASDTDMERSDQFMEVQMDFFDLNKESYANMKGWRSQ
jgi:hypothetical protein